MTLNDAPKLDDAYTRPEVVKLHKKNLNNSLHLWTKQSHKPSITYLNIYICAYVHMCVSNS